MRQKGIDRTIPIGEGATKHNNNQERRPDYGLIPKDGVGLPRSTRSDCERQR
jgi:hypothetical protein